jgi:hypothetical protein
VSSRGVEPKVPCDIDRVALLMHWRNGKIRWIDEISFDNYRQIRYAH